MLITQAQARGFSIIVVTGALAMIGLVTMAAWPLVQDHSRRAALSADRALALSEAERALDAAECEIAIATGTPPRRGCAGVRDAARAAALNPITLAGFRPGQCGDALCSPLTGQTAQGLSDLLTTADKARAVPAALAETWREPAQPARYVIEPLPDALPGEWAQAGTARAPSLFRITAVGFGLTEKVTVMLQSVYRPQADEP